MRLEGTLDAFSLPDIFQLLSFTKKTGTLHLRRASAHGAVHLRDGAVVGARADVHRHELSRRLLGAGLVDDEVLASAAEELAGDPSLSLAQLLSERGQLATDTVRALAAEQAHDAVFMLLRWPDGDFAFVQDENDPDDLGAVLAVEVVVEEGRRRLAVWAELVESVPAPDAVVAVNPAPTGDPAADRDEWALLSLVDGRRTVAELVSLAGRGEYAVVAAIAALVGRGLLLVGSSVDEKILRRHSLLAALEGQTAEPALTEPAVTDPAAAAAGAAAPTASSPAMAPAASPGVPGPAGDAGALVPAQPPAPDRQPSPALVGAPSARATTDAPPAAQAVGPVIPARPEPFTATRRPDHAEVDASPYARGGSAGTRPGAGAHGSVNGATAMQPEIDPAAAPAIERDPSVNKSLLLRLIAGVRGL